MNEYSEDTVHERRPDAEKRNEAYRAGVKPADVSA